MPRVEQKKPLMTGSLSCRGADYLTGDVSSRRSSRGLPTITIDDKANLLFSCTKESAAGNCLLSEKPQACPVRRILAGTQSSETPLTIRRTVNVVGGTLDYDVEDRTLYNWPGKTTEAPRLSLSVKAGTILDYLTKTPYEV